MEKNDKMDRAGFFRFGIRKGKEQVIKKLQKKIKRIGIRPPGAIHEDEFMIACTRCNDCVEACPHDSIFKPTYTAVGGYGETPFIDMKHKACEYCKDMPCIASCKTGALVYEQEYRRIGIAKFNEEHCLVNQGQYCDYCAKSCPREFDALQMGDNRMPIINEENCVGCGKCEYICVSQSGKAIEIYPNDNIVPVS